MADLALQAASDLIAQLAAQPDAGLRARLLAAAPSARTVAVVEQLADEATRRARINLIEASHLASAAETLATELADVYALGRSARATGHVRSLAGDYAAAMASYDAAIVHFADAARELELGITLSGALQTLIYMGRYSDAHAWAERARAIFAGLGDRLRLARLESNLGNVFYRQDRFEDALASYEAALAAFGAPDGSADVAITLRNIAVCQISLQRFEEALATYAEARTWCERQGLVRLVAEVDYNIAYLHYLRGEYARALELYAAARARARELDDHYHTALCDLDEAELYLELNLVPEGAALAKRAADAFRTLGMRYERAKALTTLAFAASRQDDLALALRRFDQARIMFVREANLHWPALIDLSKALVLERAQRSAEARRLCTAARHHFAATPLTARTALCELLLARLALGQGNVDAAAGSVDSALDLLGELDAPALRYQAHFTAGEVAEARGDRDGADASYRLAHAAVETLRSHLERDELKIAFFDDKQAVFAALASLSLARPGGEAEAFAWVERAKSRSLAEHVALHTDHTGGTPEQRAGASDVQALAQRLSAIVHQQREEERRAQPAPAKLFALATHARACDQHLVAAIAALEASGGRVTSALGPAMVPLDVLQADLDPGTRLLQYATLRGQLHVWVVGPSTLTHVALGAVADAQALVRLLRLQLGSAARETAAVPTAPARPALLAHLAALYDRLLRPVALHLGDAAHLVVLPHDMLHAVPFHALETGDGPVLDRWRVSYAPNASVHHHAAVARAAAPDNALIVARPDCLAPAMADEATRLAAHLPGAHVALGEAATRATLAAIAPRCRVVHIAAHGRFRADNPMFSSIALADGDLTVRELSELPLAAELVTLSGCSTGLSVATGGDELLGLARSLLYAGARAVLVSLWDVHDETAATLMDGVYRRLTAGDTPAEALRGAMQELRKGFPNPCLWAPFIVIGWSGAPVVIRPMTSPSIFPGPPAAYTTDHALP